eukprot:g59710.t1
MIDEFLAQVSAGTTQVIKDAMKIRYDPESPWVQMQMDRNADKMAEQLMDELYEPGWRTGTRSKPSRSFPQECKVVKYFLSTTRCAAVGAWGVPHSFVSQRKRSLLFILYSALSHLRG